MTSGPAFEADVDALLAEAKVEILRACKLYPRSDFLLTAFAEEAGEAVKAGMDIMQKGGARSALRKEIVQTIAMAVRLETEGDPIHKIPPPTKDEL